MSAPVLKPAERNRWMAWEPKARLMGDSAESEPTKPTKPGSVGFVGASSGESAKIQVEPGSTELSPSGGYQGESEHDELTGVVSSRSPIDENANPGLASARLEAHRGRQKHIETPVDFGPDTTRLMSWPEWKAAALNQLFLEQGRTGRPGRITAETVRHGERAQRAGKNLMASEGTKAGDDGGL